MEYTKGPWRAERADIYNDDPNRWSVLSRQPDGSSVFVATIENGALEDTLETEGANARLIAAAPELLEVVQALAHFSENPLTIISPLDENSPLMDAARLAIAKALPPPGARG